MRIRYSFSSRRTGHLKNIKKQREKVPALIRKVIDASDILLEVLDARFLQETRNSEVESYILKQGKKIIYILNKSDLVDTKEVKKKIVLLNLYPYVLISCKNRQGSNDLRKRIKIEAKKIEGYKLIQVGIIGYPNTGKSSLINFLTGSRLGTAASAGFTKGLHKVKLAEGILLLDTPGIIPDKENSAMSNKDLIKHAKINVRDWDKVKSPDIIVFSLFKQYPEAIEKYYSIKPDDFESFIEKLGRKNNFLSKNNQVDLDRTCRKVLRDWQEGRIKFNIL